MLLKLIRMYTSFRSVVSFYLIREHFDWDKLAVFRKFRKIFPVIVFLFIKHFLPSKLLGFRYGINHDTFSVTL